MKEALNNVERVMLQEAHDFAFCVGTVTPIRKNHRPYFIYTDLAILSNLYYPGGEQQVKLWEECLPYEQATLKDAAMVFTMSDHVSRSLMEHYDIPKERIVKVNGGCNVPPISSEDPERYEHQNILFIGVDWERKGGPQLLEAFRRVKKHYPFAMLILAGSSPRVNEPGVQVVGKVSQARIAEILSKSTIFCMPSLREPFGIAYLEAMRAGLPVIASNLGAAPDFIREGQTGYKVDPNDIDALANRIEELISDPEKCRRMGQAGRELVESEYTWPRTQQRMWQAIQSCL